MSLAARFRLRAPNSAGSSAAFARLCLLPLAIVVAAFFLLPMMLGQRVGLEHHAEAMVLGDRIVVMRHGAIAQIGTPREIYFEPASRFVAEFVGAANIVEGTARDGAIVLPGGRIPVPIGRAGKITLMLRPETIFVVPPDAAELKGRVESVTFVGDRQRIVIADAAARPLFVDAPNTIAATPGERVGLRIDPARIRVLPEEGAGSEGATPSPRRGEGWGEGDRK
ncbi:MAG: TOBE domain-containing protein [Alphaproteobacteria bacterium]|nr:MAG: TOBE domain-containing protein [Alphaproteobacteria bacterium]